jgi:hypothetical protein
MSGVLDQKTDSIARAEATSLSSSTASFCYIHTDPSTPVPHPTPPKRTQKEISLPSENQDPRNPTRRSLHHCTRRPSAVLSSAQCTAPQQPLFFSLPFLQLQNIFRTASERERERGRKSFPTGMMLDASSAVSGHQLSASFLLSCLCLRCTLGLGLGVGERGQKPRLGFAAGADDTTHGTSRSFCVLTNSFVLVTAGAGTRLKDLT